MRTITNNELFVLTKELNSEFQNFYIEKFYEIADNQFLIKLNKQHEKLFLHIILCHTVNKINYIFENEFPTNFALSVRKKIENFKIDLIEQYNNDRIIIIKISKGQIKLNLILEMFGKGNFIITDEAFKIILAYKIHMFKDRSINIGSQYIPPAISNYKNIEEEKSKIGNIKNIILYKDKNNKIVDYSLIENPKYANYIKEYKSSIEEALELYYKDNPVNIIQKTEIDKKIEELEESIKKQETFIEETKKEREELMKKGEFLINNMYLINELIAKIQKNQKIDIEILNKEFKNLTITNINLKDKHVIINIDI
jgi:predicted ribosome quality control (RQC) complex YloA/Tae2 family protein